MKKFILFSLFFFSYLLTFSQDNKDYIQELPATNETIEMKFIPGGSFILGSSATEVGRKPDENNAQNVEVDAFWMASHEITWGLYKLFLQREIDAEVVENSLHLDVDGISGATTPYVDMSLGMGTDDNLPVGNVTWLAATRFCKWLSAITGNFYRLPTESEWEYAAQAGNENAYSFGNDVSKLSDYAWHADNSDNKYHPIKEKEPNAWGLYDMNGNVAEWTLNQYTENGYAEESVFEVATKQHPISIRGGSFQDDAADVRSASRQPSKAIWKQRDPQFPKSKWWNTDAPFVGFRIVRPLNPPVVEDYGLYWPEKVSN